MSSYADTSFLVSLYGKDVNSHSAIALVKRYRPVFLVTPFGEVEFTSIVLAIAARPKGWTVNEARAIEESFVRDLQSGVWQWEDLPPETWHRARELSRRYAPVLASRAMDALHVACALLLAADDFYTFDRDQAKLARAAGLAVLGT
ncbi:MAG: type II toxin-antitoxin system VapC family toxin [Acidobacteriia bacterium]|nr:type II toxin-antitoxin system VapC family toxin [Terriglobia bacterium]